MVGWKRNLLQPGRRPLRRKQALVHEQQRKEIQQLPLVRLRKGQVIKDKEEEAITFAEDEANKNIAKLDLDKKEQPKKNFFKK